MVTFLSGLAGVCRLPGEDWGSRGKTLVVQPLSFKQV